MTTLGAIGAQNPMAGGAQQSLGGLDGEAFLKLLVAQMRYQDPMSPSDPSQMMQQTAQFTQVESLQKIAKMQQQMLGLSGVNVAASMIGKEVDAVTDQGRQVSGVVESVGFSESGPTLRIGGQDVPFDTASEIRSGGDPLPAAPAAPAEPEETV